MQISVIRSDRRNTKHNQMAFQRYKNVYRNRYVAWNPAQQVFEIRQRNRITNEDTRIIFIAEYIPSLGHRLPLDFDNEWVDSSLEGLYLINKLGSEGLTRYINEQNHKDREAKLDKAAEKITGQIEYAKDAFFPKIKSFIPKNINE